jgi:hypothetical protein
MSYDLAVFDPACAPREREAFLAWFRTQTTWVEGRTYDDPVVSSPSLQAWFASAIATFPPMSGPFAARSMDSTVDADEDELRTADYSVGREVIYVAFAWSRASEAHALVFSLAAQHGLGFFDASSSLGEVWLPGKTGALVLQHLDEEAQGQQRRREALEAWVRGGPGELNDWLGPDGEQGLADEEAMTRVASLSASLKRVGWLDEHGSAAIWLGHALDALLSAADPSITTPAYRAALLPRHKPVEGLRRLRLGDEGCLLYPKPSASRGTGGDCDLLTGHEVVSPFSLSLVELTKGLARAGHPRPGGLAEALLASAATAVLGRDAQFHEGALVEFRTVTKGAAVRPNQIALDDARAVDPAAQPGEEYGFVSTWRGWLYPLLDWLYASQSEPR